MFGGLRQPTMFETIFIKLPGLRRMKLKHGNSQRETKFIVGLKNLAMEKWNLWYSSGLNL